MVPPSWHLPETGVAHPVILTGVAHPVILNSFQDPSFGPPRNFVMRATLRLVVFDLMHRSGGEMDAETSLA